MSEYIKLLQAHDWYYNYSDDFSYWSKGRKERDRLLQLRLDIDSHSLVWNQYAPSNFKINTNIKG